MILGGLWETRFNEFSHHSLHRLWVGHGCLCRVGHEWGHAETRESEQCPENRTPFRGVSGLHAAHRLAGRVETEGLYRWGRPLDCLWTLGLDWRKDDMGIHENGFRGEG